MDVELAKKVVSKAAEEAGALLESYKGRADLLTTKKKHTLTTDVDIKAEKIILDAITSNFKDHDILSEEKGFEGHDSEYLWIVDPIDGTVNYYYGNPPYRVAICLLKNKEPLLSWLYNPARNGGEMCFAEKGKGTFLNGVKATVSDRDDLSKAIVMTHLSSDDNARAHTILALDRMFRKSMHIRMFGSGLAAMNYVAYGRFDVYVNIKSNPWDILPGVLIIEEAGGMVTEIDGSSITPNSTSVLATNGKLHKQMLEVLKDI